jgi:uncharacterized sporulation protein YeaH/YhbH (DUF444 family)
MLKNNPSGYMIKHFLDPNGKLVKNEKTYHSCNGLGHLVEHECGVSINVDPARTIKARRARARARARATKQALLKMATRVAAPRRAKEMSIVALKAINVNMDTNSFRDDECPYSSHPCYHQ